MSKYIVFVLAMFGSIYNRVLADEVTSSVVGTKVPYQRQIPREVRSKVPHGGQTIFFGVAKWSSQKFLVGLHLYVLQLGSEERPLFEKGFMVSPRCVLDVFTMRGAGKTKIFHRVSSVPCNSNSIHYSSVDFSHTDEFGKVGMTLLWLDSKQRSIPIVKIDTHSPALYPGWGRDILVVFPKGLSGNAVLQGFGRGADNSSAGNSWGSTFDQRDQKGWLVVQTFLRTNNQSGYDKILLWNGKAFVPGPEEAK